MIAARALVFLVLATGTVQGASPLVGPPRPVPGQPLGLPVSAESTRIVESILAIPEFVTAFRMLATGGPAALVGVDRRIPPADKARLSQALTAAFPVEEIQAKAKSIWASAWTEKELAALLAFFQSPAGRKLFAISQQTENRMAAYAEKHIAARYEKITGLKFPPPPKPRESDADFMTDLLWKIFPDTNQCKVSP